MRTICIEFEGSGVRTSQDVRVLDSDGDVMHGISALTIRVDNNDVVRATLELSAFGVKGTWANGTFAMADPRTGEMKAIRRIDFADGSSWHG